MKKEELRDIRLRIIVAMLNDDPKLYEQVRWLVEE